MEKTISSSMLCDFENHLKLDEKSENTVKKHLRDIDAFARYAEGREVTKSLVLDYKSALSEEYELSSANSMIAAENAFFRFLIDALKSIESNTKKGGTAIGGTPDAYKEKKADKRAKNARLSTFIGGGEGNRTPVRKSLDTAFSGCSRLFKIPLVRRKPTFFRFGYPFSA